MMLLPLVVLLVAVAAAVNAEQHPRDAQLLSKLAHFETLEADPLAARRRALRGESTDDFTYSLRALGADHSLDLSLFRSLFSEDFASVHVDRNGGRTVASTEKHCVYRGANGTIVSFCGGVVHARFLHAHDGEEVNVRPLASGEHIAYRRRDLQEEKTGECGLTEEVIAQQRAHQAAVGSAKDAAQGSFEGGRRLQVTTTNEVELLIVNDNERWKRYGPAVDSDTAFIASLVADLYTGLPGDDAVIVKLVGIYTMTESDAWSVSVVNGGLSVEVNLLLDSFQNYMGNEKNVIVPAFSLDPVLPQFDHAHLLTGYDMFSNGGGGNDGVVGLAVLGRVCAENDDGGATGDINRAGLTQATFDDQAYTAAIFTHELGHNLGMRHTAESDLAEAPNSPCNTPAGEVMDATVSGANPVWSSCSHEYFGTLRSTVSCLDAAASEWTPPVCGNGIREFGEDCDCLLNDCAGVDPCCDGATCTLTMGDCSAFHDPCCDAGSCTATSDTALVCRPSADATCDTAEETCDGVSASCPLDVVVAAGTSCGSNGKCWLGQCRSNDEKCEQLGYNDGGLVQACGGDLGCCSDAGCGSFFVLEGYFPDDGAPCATGGGDQCYQGSCVTSASLPTPADLQFCSNLIQDGTETDVDCGGDDCLPCVAGRNCTVNADCLFPGFCNATTLTCVVTGGSGVRGDGGAPDEDPNLQDQVLAGFDKFLEWAKENPAAAGGAGAALFVVLFFCCFGCICCGGKDKVPQYARQMKQASFRNMRGGRQKQDQLAPTI